VLFRFRLDEQDWNLQKADLSACFCVTMCALVALYVNTIYCISVSEGAAIALNRAAHQYLLAAPLLSGALRVYCTCIYSVGAEATLHGVITFRSLFTMIFNPCFLHKYCLTNPMHYPHVVYLPDCCLTNQT
jgi:hypothetical protein